MSMVYLSKSIRPNIFALFFIIIIILMFSWCYFLSFFVLPWVWVFLSQKCSRMLTLNGTLLIFFDKFCWISKNIIHVISPNFGGSSGFGGFPHGLTLGRRNLPTRGFSNVIFLGPYFSPNILSFTALSAWRIICLQLKSVWHLSI